MDNKCIFSRKEDGICEYKNEVRTSQSEVQKTSIKLMQSPRETTAQFWKRGKPTKRGKRIVFRYIIKKGVCKSSTKKKSKKISQSFFRL